MDLDYGYLMDLPGRLEVPRVPRRWTSEIRPYAAVLRPGHDRKLDRSFVTAINFSRTRKTGELVCDFDFDDLPIGTLLEIRRKNKRKMSLGQDGDRPPIRAMQAIYRRDLEGWQVICWRYPFCEGSLKSWKFWNNF